MNFGEFEENYDSDVFFNEVSHSLRHVLDILRTNDNQQYTDMRTDDLVFF